MGGEGLYRPVFELTKAMIEFVMGTGSFGSVREYLLDNELANSINASLAGVSMVIRGGAASLAVILWFPSLLQAALNHQAYEELVIKRFIYLGVSLALIANSYQICTGITNIGVALMGDIQGESASGEADGLIRSLEESLERIAQGEDEELHEEEGFSEEDSAEVRVLSGFRSKVSEIFSGIMNQMRALSQALGFFMALCLPWMAAVVARVIIVVACYMRSVEICILTVLSPIPFAMISNEPLGAGPGARFLKNLAALAIQGAVMMVIAGCCQAIMGNKLMVFTSVTADFAGLMTAGVEVGAVAVCEAALLLKSLTFAQKALGLQ